MRFKRIFLHLQDINTIDLAKHSQNKRNRNILEGMRFILLMLFHRNSLLLSLITCEIHCFCSSDKIISFTILRNLRSIDIATICILKSYFSWHLEMFNKYILTIIYYLLISFTTVQLVKFLYL